MPIRISAKVTLVEGDKIRVSSGPYFVTKKGTKICMGEKGVGIFTSISEKQDGIFVKFGNNIPRFVYIGNEYISPTTNVVMKPHKITKLRK